MTHSIHQKGFDSFTTTEYVEGVGPLRDALTESGFIVDYLPAHIAMREFPSSTDELAEYACVILSDIGANSLLLHPDTFAASRPTGHRLRALAQYVRGGGGLVMIGGYMTFQGIDGKGRWHGTAVEDVLPVVISPVDDRVEEPAGIQPITVAQHSILDGVDGRWPDLLGYNRVTADPVADVLVKVGDDPLLVVADIDLGRSAAFTSDCAPHWAPPPFVDWQHYQRLWGQLVGWVVGQ